MQKILCALVFMIMISTASDDFEAPEAPETAELGDFEAPETAELGEMPEAPETEELGEMPETEELGEMPEADEEIETEDGFVIVNVPATAADTTAPADAADTTAPADAADTTAPADAADTTAPGALPLIVETTPAADDDATTAAADGDATTAAADGDATTAAADGDATTAAADGDATTAAADGDATAAADDDATTAAADGDATTAAADDDATTVAADDATTPEAADNQATTLPAGPVSEVELAGDFSAITDLDAWLADCTAALSKPTMKCESARAGSVIVAISADNQADLDSEVANIQTNGITIAGTAMTAIPPTPATPVAPAPIKPCYIAFEDLEGYMGGPCIPIESDNPMMAQMIMNGGLIHPAMAAMIAGGDGDMEFDSEDMAKMLMNGGGQMNMNAAAQMAMMSGDGFADNLQAKHEQTAVVTTEGDNALMSFNFLLLICAVLLTAILSLVVANYVNKRRKMSPFDIPLTEEDIMV